MKDGRILVAGNNSVGQLGLRHYKIQDSFAEVSDLKGKVDKIYTLENTVLYQLKDGRVLTSKTDFTKSGFDFLCQLAQQNWLVEVPALKSRVRYLFINEYSAWVQLQDGRFLVTGLNHKGQLGLGHFENQKHFVEVPDFDGEIIAIHSNMESVWIQLNDGRWLAAGNNKVGQLGLPHFTSGNKLSRFTEIPGIIGKVMATHIRGTSVWFQMEDERVLATGNNEVGQLGLGHFEHQYGFVEIPALTGQLAAIYITKKGHGVFAQTKGGQVWVTGLNSYGQLGLGPKKDQACFIAIPGLIGKVTAIYLGDEDFTFLQMNDHRILVAGNNKYGQLGLGEWASNKYLNRFIEVPGLIGEIAGINIIEWAVWVHMKDGRILVAGKNQQSEFGLGHDQEIISQFVETPFKNRYIFYSPFTPLLQNLRKEYEQPTENTKQDVLILQLRILHALASGYAQAILEKQELADFFETTIATVNQTQHWQPSSEIKTLMQAGQTGALLTKLGLFKEPVQQNSFALQKTIEMFQTRVPDKPMI